MEQTLNDNQISQTEIAYFKKPSLILRIKAMVIDAVIIIALMFLASVLLNAFHVESGKIRGMFLFFIWLYEPIFISLKGTIGQNMMGLRVVQAKKMKEVKEKRNINLWASLLRYLTKLLLGWVSLLTIHSDHYGQAIHDKVGQSIMTFK